MKRLTQRTLRIVARARANKVARAVVVCLSKWGRLGTNPKTVARESRYPLRTVQRAISRLLEVEEVVEVSRGMYALASTYFDLTSDPTALLGFQNLRFSVKRWRIDLSPPCRTARPWRQFDSGDSGSGEMTELQWEGRQVKLLWRAERDHLYVIIAAKTPIPLERAGELKGWLDATLGLGRGEETEVDYIEVNSDHRNARLEPTYLELRDLPGVAHVIYQHGAVLREEIRLAKPRGEEAGPIGLARALELLMYGSPLSRMERLLDKELMLAQSPSYHSSRRRPYSDPAAARDSGYG